MTTYRLALCCEMTQRELEVGHMARCKGCGKVWKRALEEIPVLTEVTDEEWFDYVGEGHARR